MQSPDWFIIVTVMSIVDDIMFGMFVDTKEHICLRFAQCLGGACKDVNVVMVVCMMIHSERVTGVVSNESIMIQCLITMRAPCVTNKIVFNYLCNSVCLYKTL